MSDAPSPISAATSAEGRAAPLACWCGATDLAPFCAGYVRCAACETLVSAEMPSADLARVVDEERDFYGRAYWFSYQERHLGHPTIVDRARSDLPERCLHWLEALLRYRRPPARVLELGSGHGGFVALLRGAGFDAAGLEVSPWVVDFARSTFGVPVLKGPIDDQALAPGSLDVIVLMDVLEHLRDPMGTLRHCLDRLAPGGLLLIQTPCYPAGSTYGEMAAKSAQPLEILQPREHLYLFSERSIAEMFRRLGAPHVAFEPALFAEYDMFCVVGREPIARRAPGDRPLALTPSARLVQALLDGRGAARALEAQVAAAEADRAARLGVIEAQGRRLGEVEAERNNLRAEVAELRGHMAAVEADRAARLAFMEEQGRRLGEVEGDRNRLRSQAETLRGQLDGAEADRAARLDVIRQQGRRIEACDAEIAAQAEQMRIVIAQMRALQRVLQAIVESRVGVLMRRLGRWRFIDHVDPAAGPPARTE